jgi:hypothetical protein
MQTILSIVHSCRPFVTQSRAYGYRYIGVSVCVLEGGHCLSKLLKFHGPKTVHVAGLPLHLCHYAVTAGVPGAAAAAVTSGDEGHRNDALGIH